MERSVAVALLLHPGSAVKSRSFKLLGIQSWALLLLLSFASVAPKSWAGGGHKSAHEPVAPATELCGTSNHQVLGAVEHVAINEAGLTLHALVDTGAKTTSLDARNIRLSEASGTRMADYTLINRYTGAEHAMRSQVVRIAKVIRHTGQILELPVVELNLKVGEVVRQVEVSLMDRASFPFPMLLGRNFFKEGTLIDPSKYFLTGD